MSHNPLLTPINELVDYSAIQASHVVPAIDQLLAQAKTAVEQVQDSEGHSWETLVDPLEDAVAPLWRAWTIVGHLNSVVNTPELRDAYNSRLPHVTEFSTWLGLNAKLFAKYQALRASDDYTQLSKARQRVVDLALRDFRLSGVELEGAQRERYAELSEQQAAASQRFSENVLDSIDGWHLLIPFEDSSRVAGIPADVLQAAATAAKAAGHEQSYLLTLKMPCYLPVMQYAQDRFLRETLYRAYATIASDQAEDLSKDNSKVIEELLSLRAEEAQLLGYQHFAELRLETRMAESAEQVVSFLHDLAKRSKAFAQQDLTELKAFAQTHLQLDELMPWDVPYAAERLREQRYDYSEDEIKQYFTEPTVLKGLFTVTQRLFGLSFQAISAPGWHADVQAYEVYNSTQQLKGYLYIDLYARTGKQGGAWVNSERERRLTADGVDVPVVYLVCNFSAPQGDTPALLTHDDVITLFHESGHALHALVSEVDEPAVSAFRAVEWDAIELPSQFMENFCWEWSVIQELSSHVATGQPLPRELFDKLLAAKNFQSGMMMVRQLEFALFDMLIHQANAGLSIAEVLHTLSQVRDQVAVIHPPAWHRFPHAFSHLFAGGYGAGYYSYKWAEVLSADAYAAFEEASSTHDRNTLHADTGRRFLKEVLAVGGTRSAAESFEAFRGRSPQVDALLRHSGFVTTESSL